MTNTRELMTVSSEEEAALKTKLVSGASSEAPSPSSSPMQGKSNSDIASTTTMKPSGDEVEWVIAAGNAAKAARRGGLRTTPLQPNGEHETVAAPSSHVNDDDDDDDVAGYNEKKNESTTPNAGDDVDDDDDEDYNSHNSEEEDGAYKTSSSATLSQSVHIVQQEDQERNALIASIRLFLVQTWNWLHYLFVTILFLNLFDSDRGDSSLEHLRADTPSNSSSVVVDEENEKDSEQSAEGGSGSEINNIASGSNTNNSLLEEEAKIMSPNTCSIQEKAQEAIMAGEKGDDSVEGAIPQEKLSQHPEITIIVSDSEDVQECDEVEEGEEVVEIGVMGRRDSVNSYSSSEGSGNMGDTEEGGKSEENNNILLNTEESGKLLTQKIISQVEAMFSDEHLAKDGFLLKHVRRRSDGFVSLKLVAGLRKVKQISRDFPVVLDALRDSTKLEINQEGSKVRRVEPLTSVLKSVPIKAKEKTSNKDKENGSSNDENQQPNASIQQKNKFEPTEMGKGNNSNNQNGSRRNSGQPINSSNNGSSQSRRNSNQTQRKSSNTSTASSNNSRHNSFSKPCPPPAHPADLLRNVYASSSGEDSQSPQGARRRGGSLPIAALQRASGSYLSPNSSPPNGSAAFMGPNGVRPKSNSYCEGASPTTMSPWLQRRKASASSRLSSGELIFSGVVRQPRGPDGTKGFPNGYRAMILEERLQQQSNSAVSA